MSDPLERFRAVFFDESAEAIDAIERNLLNVDDASDMDSETINDIFPFCPFPKRWQRHLRYGFADRIYPCNGNPSG